MCEKTMVRSFVAVALVASAVSSQADVFKMPSGETSLQFVTVGNPGNAADPTTGYGAVGYTYQMGKYDVTNAQYIAFLNAVARLGDPETLYVQSGSDPHLGITRTGSGTVASPYVYASVGGDSNWLNRPVVGVTWYDTLRFANWLQNGQPTTGGENAGTTENGAYQMSLGAGAVREPGATFFLPTLNEWYKAAYYDPTKPGGAGYWSYPTCSNTAPIAELPPGGSNSANSTGQIWGNPLDPTYFTTPVGAYNNTISPCGALDRAGNVWNWTEGRGEGLAGNGSPECGGGYDYPIGYSASNAAGIYGGNPPQGADDLGFRVAASKAVPEPSTITLLATGAIGLVGYGWRRRRAMRRTAQSELQDDSPAILPEKRPGKYGMGRSSCALVARTQLLNGTAAEVARSKACLTRLPWLGRSISARWHRNPQRASVCPIDPKRRSQHARRCDPSGVGDWAAIVALGRNAPGLMVGNSGMGKLAGRD